MDNNHYKVFRVTNEYGGIISCHIFSASTEEKLNKKIKKQFIEWSRMGPKGVEYNAEETEIRQKDEKKIIKFIDQEMGQVSLSWHDELVEYINRDCEFTQKY